MKILKKIFTLLLPAVAGGAAAADVITIPDVTIAPGETGEIVISYAFTEEEYVGFDARLTLPGDNMVVCEEPANKSDGNEVVCSFSQLKAADGYQLFSYSYLEEATNPRNEYKFSIVNFYGTALPSSGELLKITVKADENAVLGTEYTATLSNISVIYNDEFYNAHDRYLEDVQFKIILAEPDNTIRFDENSTSLPSYTAGAKGDVAMTRTIKAGEWSTVVLPFTLTKSKAEDALGNDVKLAEFTGFEVDYGDDDENVVPLGITLKFSSYTMTAKKPMTGGKPFLVKTSKDIESIEAEDATLFDVVTDVEKTDEYDTPGKFTGTFVKTVVPVDGLFLSGNKFWYSAGKTNIKAFRGWFELGAVLDKETDFSANVSFFVDDEPTSVDGVPAASLFRRSGVYTIGGQYIGRDIDNRRLPAGIYIINGKKVIR